MPSKPSEVTTAPRSARRAELLAAAARIMGERGFNSMRLDDVGAAVGISGPALYRHFKGKQALLAEVLIDISQRLHDGGHQVLAQPAAPSTTLDRLIAFHINFAFTETDLIRIQDREMLNLNADGRTEVARLQRGYLACWYATLAQLRPGDSNDAIRARCRAVVGMINASRHVVDRDVGPSTRDLLPAMCRSALGA